jgi:hypothetical protein
MINNDWIEFVYFVLFAPNSNSQNLISPRELSLNYSSQYLITSDFLKMFKILIIIIYM